jgi:2-polyprenyl-6-methoxyphenol hydroxylase-like FAD-dependent oxidoreductase
MTRSLSGPAPPAGPAAILLARAGWSVALVERKQFPRKKVCGEYLSATNLALFERLGLHDRFIDQAGPEVKRVALYAGTGTPEADLPLPESRVRGWGRALSREHLDTLLVQTARELGVDVRQPATVRRFPPPEQVSITFRSNRSMLPGRACNCVRR